MKRYVNGVDCDTIAYLDDKSTGETITFALTGRTNFNIVVYLFADGKPFPVDQSLTAICCATKARLNHSYEKTVIDCTIGSHGEIVFAIPAELRVASLLFCEIRVSGTDEHNEDFVYRASNFRVAIIL